MARPLAFQAGEDGSEPSGATWASGFILVSFDAGWSSSVAHWAHNPEVGGSNPPPATRRKGLGPAGYSREPRPDPGSAGGAASRRREAW